MVEKKREIEESILQKILKRQAEALSSHGLSKGLIEKISIALKSEQDQSSLLEVLKKDENIRTRDF